MQNFKNNKKIIKYIGNVIYPLISLGIIVAVWAIVSHIYGNPLVLPMPGVVISRFFSLFGTSQYWINVGNTIGRTILCFVISFISALLLASVGVIFKPVHRILNPIISFFRATPTVAVILIMYAFMRNTSLAIFVGFLIAFPLLYTAFYSALDGVDKDLIEMTKVYHVSPQDKIFKLYLSSITNCIFDNSRSTISLTLKIIVASEILTLVSSSIGGSINSANLSFIIADLLAWTLVAIFWSYILELIVLGLKKLWMVLK